MYAKASSYVGNSAVTRGGTLRRDIDSTVDGDR